MKFDKFMEHCFKILALVTALVVSFGLATSCFAIPARADSFDDPVYWGEQALRFKEQLEQGLQESENALITDIKNGNLDATSALAKQRMQAYALQQLALTSPALFNIYHSAELAIQGIPTDYFDNPSEISISGSGMGAYYYNSSGDLNVSFLYLTDRTSSAGEHILVNAPDFTFKFISTGEDTAKYEFYQDGTSYPFIFNRINTGDLTLICDYPDNTYTDYTELYTSPLSFSSTFHVYSNQIPTIGFFGWQPFRDAVVGGLGETVVMPVGNIETNRPYDYYNNILLPYIQQNYLSLPDSDIIFPSGWFPTDPVEPPTTPNGGITINNKNTNFNIGINIIYPTDSNGQPITDTEGQTVTETEYISDTSPLDGEYSFQMPTLETLHIYNETIPPPRLSDFSNGLDFIWTSTTGILENSGFMPVVLTMLSLAIIGYILWKIGG